MSDEKKNEGKELEVELAVTLESSDTNDSTAVSSLFSIETLESAGAKLNAVECLLALVNRDCKFPEFMREVCLIAVRAIPSEAGSLLEIDPKNESFFFRATVGTVSEKMSAFSIPKGQGIVGHVAESKQPLAVNAVEENKIHLRAIQNAVGFETRNMLAAPILIRGKVFAVVEILNRVGEPDYSPADIEMITYFCNAAAKVIEARLTLNWALKSQGIAA